MPETPHAPHALATNEDPKRPGRRSAGLAAAAIAACFVLQSWLNMRLGALDHDPISIAVSSEGVLKWSPELFKAMSFGHWTSGLDWVWIKTLANPSTAHAAQGEHAPIYHDMDLITELDPAYYEIYYAGAHLLSVIRDDASGARDLLLKAERFRKSGLPGYPEEFRNGYWGNAWSLPLLQAYIHLFELNDIRTAAGYFVTAAEAPGSPPYLDVLARRFEKPGGEYEVGLRLLNFMVETAPDAEAKAKLESRRKSLYVAQYLYDLSSGFRQFLAGQAEYARSSHLTRAQMESFWRRFRKESGIPSADPFGGELSIDRDGKVRTTTPRERVFGLE